MNFKGLKYAKDDIFLLGWQQLLTLNGTNDYILLTINIKAFQAWRHTSEEQELIATPANITLLFNHLLSYIVQIVIV